MKWFLDMCIILHYIKEGDNQSLIRKTVLFVNQKNQDKFFLCCYIKEENLPKWLKRRRIIFREVLRQIRSISYIPYSDEECNLLWGNDKNQVLKLMAIANNLKDKTEIISNFENAYQEIQRRISEFLKKYIDEYVIPIKNIDSDLKRSLLDYLDENHSDAYTLASGIQQHNEEELVLITSDVTHWKKRALEEAVPEHSELRKKYPKLPEIKHIQDM